METQAIQRSPSARKRAATLRTGAPRILRVYCLYRKARGREARLCFGAHWRGENRHGLCADLAIHDPIAEPDPRLALRQLQAHSEPHEGVRVKTVAADKAELRRDFVAGCRQQGIVPHGMCKAGVSGPGLDGRTTNRPGYQLSQRTRKRVEEIYGWIKTVGAAESLSGARADAGVGVLCGGRLQSAADGAVEGGERMAMCFGAAGDDSRSGKGPAAGGLEAPAEGPNLSSSASS